MPGGTIIDSIQINQGNNRELYALQQDGYILFPTERTATLNVVECSNYTWSFP
jgi:predicted acetyltransferase